MKDFFVILLIASPLWATALIAFAIWRWEIRELPRIKFKNFKKFYELNPTRWGLCSSYVSCDVGDSCRNEVFVFSVVDYFKYKLWCHAHDKHKTNLRNIKSTQLMLDAVKEDVANAKAKERDAVIAHIIKDLNNTPLNDEIPSLIELLKKYSADIKEQ